MLAFGVDHFEADIRLLAADSIARAAVSQYASSDLPGLMKATDIAQTGNASSIPAGQRSVAFCGAPAVVVSASVAQRGQRKKTPK